MKSQPANDVVHVKGFFRLNIMSADYPTVVVGDSGWRRNQITNLGYNNFICGAMGQLTGSSNVGYMSLGSGGTVAAVDTTLGGEISNTKRQAVTAASSSTSKAAVFTATFSSSNSFLAGSSNLSNMGLFANTSSGATMCAGNTYASSACATNQNINCTYVISFA